MQFDKFFNQCSHKKRFTQVHLITADANHSSKRQMQIEFPQIQSKVYIKK